MPGFIEFDPQNRMQMEVLMPRLLILAGELTVRAGDQVIFEPFDLSVARFSLLASLARAPRPLTMTEIKDFILRSPANLTQMVDYLEQRNLVQRTPRVGDRRVNILELTDDGRKLLGQVQSVYAKTMKDFLHNQSSDELRTLIFSLLEVVRGMMDILGMEPPHLHEEID